MTVGTLRKLSIDGDDFALLADSDIDKKPDVMNSMIPTTGKPLQKQEKQAPETTGFKIAYSKENEMLLYNKLGDQSLKQFQYTDGDGSDFFCEGSFNITATSTMNGSIDITVLPSEQWV